MTLARRTPGRALPRIALWCGVPVISTLLSTSGSAAPTSSPPTRIPPVVVAVLGEDGVNVLHQDFQRQHLPANPSLPSATSVALPRSGSFAARLAAAENGPLGHLLAGRLYRINGTNIVGVYNPVEASTPVSQQQPANLFADTEHGTGVLSAVGGRHFGTAPDVELVIVLGSAHNGWKWVAQQNWIDFVSTSFLQTVPGAAPLTAICDAQREVEAVNARGGVVFSANGNDPGMSALPPASFPDVYHVGGVDASGHTVLFAPSAAAVTPNVGPDRPYESGELFDFPAASGWPFALSGGVGERVE